MKDAFVSNIETLNYYTKGRLDFITITDDVENIIKRSGVYSGIVVIQTNHTTCGVLVNENEKNLIGPRKELGYDNDFKKVLDRFAGPDEKYGHNDVRDSKNPSGKRDTHLCAPDSCGVVHECKNGHAHAQSMLIPCSLSMVIEKGALVKGPWQEILLVELDHDRPRRVTIAVQGIKK